MFMGSAERGTRAGSETALNNLQYITHCLWLSQPSGLQVMVFPGSREENANETKKINEYNQKQYQRLIKSTLTEIEIL